MSTYKGWAVKLANGDFMDDESGGVGCALYPVKRLAIRGKNWNLGDADHKGAKVVRVNVKVEECRK